MDFDNLWTQEEVVMCRTAFFGFLLLLIGWSVSASACGEPQEGGPRGVAYRNADEDDGGAGRAQVCTEIACEAPATCIESVEHGVASARCECPMGYRVEDGVRCFL